MARPRKSLKRRFYNGKFRKHASGCWVWTAFRNRDGYGAIGKGGRNSGYHLAHRASWMIHRGRIPKGLLVLHSCDNPACVNPAHLHLGTASQNSLEMAQRNRQAQGEQTRRNRLTWEQVRNIRRLLKTKLLNHVQIARAYEVRRETIWEIAHQKTWKGYIQCSTDQHTS